MTSTSNYEQFSSDYIDYSSQNEIISNNLLKECITSPPALATLAASQNNQSVSVARILPVHAITTQNINILPQNRSLNYYALYNILSKHIKSAKSLDNAISKIEFIPSDGAILFSDIINSLTVTSRPDAKARKIIIEEFRESGIVKVTELKRLSIKLERGTNFQ